MKNLLTLLFVFSLAGTINAQEIKKADMKSKAKVEKGTMTPFNQFYGKKLSIVSHSKDKEAIGHQATDYVLLNENGTYQHDYNGTIQAGNWTYNPDNKTLTIVNTGATAKRYVVSDATADGMILTMGTEILKVKK